MRARSSLPPSVRADALRPRPIGSGADDEASSLRRIAQSTLELLTSRFGSDAVVLSPVEVAPDGLGASVTLAVCEGLDVVVTPDVCTVKGPGPATGVLSAVLLDNGFVQRPGESHELIPPPHWSAAAVVALLVDAVTPHEPGGQPPTTIALVTPASWHEVAAVSSNPSGGLSLRWREATTVVRLRSEGSQVHIDSDPQVEGLGDHIAAQWRAQVSPLRQHAAEEAASRTPATAVAPGMHPEFPRVHDSCLQQLREGRAHFQRIEVTGPLSWSGTAVDLAHDLPRPDGLGVAVVPGIQRGETVVLGHVERLLRVSVDGSVLAEVTTSVTPASETVLSGESVLQRAEDARALAEHIILMDTQRSELARVCDRVVTEARVFSTGLLAGATSSTQAEGDLGRTAAELFQAIAESLTVRTRTVTGGSPALAEGAAYLLLHDPQQGFRLLSSMTHFRQVSGAWWGRSLVTLLGEEDVDSVWRRVCRTVAPTTALTGQRS